MTEEEEGELEVEVVRAGWPDQEDVPLEHKCRVWCLLTALENSPNAGGRPVLDLVREAIAAADLIQAWIVEAKVPRKPTLVGKEPRDA